MSCEVLINVKFESASKSMERIEKVDQNAARPGFSIHLRFLNLLEDLKVSDFYMYLVLLCLPVTY